MEEVQVGSHPRVGLRWFVFDRHSGSLLYLQDGEVMILMPYRYSLRTAFILAFPRVWRTLFPIEPIVVDVVAEPQSQLLYELPAEYEAVKIVRDDNEL